MSYNVNKSNSESKGVKTNKCIKKWYGNIVKSENASKDDDESDVTVEVSDNAEMMMKLTVTMQLNDDGCSSDFGYIL